MQAVAVVAVMAGRSTGRSLKGRNYFCGADCVSGDSTCPTCGTGKEVLGDGTELTRTDIHIR